MPKRKLLLAMFIGTSLYFTFPAVAIAEEHKDFDLERIHEQLDIQEREMVGDVDPEKGMASRVLVPGRPSE